MTIPEAVHLVLQAGAMGERRRAVRAEDGRAVRIVDLAQDLMRLSGLGPRQSCRSSIRACARARSSTRSLWEDAARCRRHGTRSVCA